eukprot:GILJ01020566.1.p1 GENE.GILJ01020566.1~~GILJ01020566.1.p1  ORF type:complete len:228 (-),score=21.01 GILJ01020566.1:125-808(-)
MSSIRSVRRYPSYPEPWSKKLSPFGDDTAAAVDRYDEVEPYSRKVLYAAPAARYRHSPYAALFTFHLKAVNLAFERGAHAEGDLRALFTYLSDLISVHAAEHGHCAPAKHFARVTGMDGNDTETCGFYRAGRPIPAKERYFVVQTTYPELSEFLHSPKLHVLSDRKGFHVSYDGVTETRSLGEEEHRVEHSSAAMRVFCDRVRGLGLRARHRATDGLPCTAVKFDCL